MIEKIKKVALVITIAVIFTIFAVSLANAIYPRPEYDDSCINARAIAPEIKGEAADMEKYDKCHEEYQLKRDKYELFTFVILAIIGLAAITFSMVYGKETAFWNVVNGGMLLGGLATLFIGTMIYYNDMARYVKPIVMLLELGITIFVAGRVIQKSNAKK